MEVTQRRLTSRGGWSSTRRGTFVIAAISTALAAGILAFALHRYRESVTTVPKPITVLVANRFIEKGTSGAAIGVGVYFHFAKVAAKNALPGALVGTSGLHGQVASTDIYAGQQLTASDFVGGGLFYSRLPTNLRAVSVPVDTSHGMIGNVQTGDRVDVYVSFKKEEKKEAFLRLVAPNVVVLDAGQLPKNGGLSAITTASTAANVVLEVSNHQAAELAFSADFGKVWLVLAPAHSTRPGSAIVNELSILAENPGVTLGGGK